MSKIGFSLDSSDRQYHIVWVPKYRHRILTGHGGHEVGECIRAFSEQKGCEILELNVQIDHVHVVVMVLPKLSISDFVRNGQR